jgi:Protein of unknown function (DUF3102)
MSTTIDKPLVPAPAPAAQMSEPELVTRIRDQLKELEETANKIKQTMLKQALDLGGLLLQAKERVGHGKFGQWLEKNALSISERSAQRYMALKEQWPKIDAWLKANSATVADLSLRKAEKIITSREDDDDKNNPSDKYDKAEAKLIEKLKDLEISEAEAAAETTSKELRKTVATMKAGAKSKAA